MRPRICWDTRMPIPSSAPSTNGKVQRPGSGEPCTWLPLREPAVSERESILGAPIDSPLDFDLQLFHDLWRIEPDSLELLGCALLGILKRIFIFPDGCGHNVMAASVIGALIDKAFHESRQRPKESGAFSHLC